MSFPTISLRHSSFVVYYLVISGIFTQLWAWLRIVRIADDRDGLFGLGDVPMCPVAEPIFINVKLIRRSHIGPVVRRVRRLIGQPIDGRNTLARLYLGKSEVR